MFTSVCRVTEYGSKGIKFVRLKNKKWREEYVKSEADTNG